MAMVMQTGTEMLWYLSVNPGYINLINYMKSLSEIRGSVSASTTNAFAGSFPAAVFNPSDPNNKYLNDALQSVNKLYDNHRARKVAVSSIAAISDIVASACDNFSSSLEKSAEDLSDAPEPAKTDCLQSLTPEVASSVSLKNKFEYGVRDPLEESLTIYDISASRWFYYNNASSLESTKTCVVVGLPAGFTSLISRKEIEVEDNYAVKGSSGQNLPASRDPSKFVTVASARSVVRPYDNINPSAVSFFHPHIHAYISAELDRSKTILALLSDGSISLMCYDKLSGTWVDTSFEDCRSFLINGGSFSVSTYYGNPSVMPARVADEVIFHHANDAILKSTVRAMTGIDLRESSVSTSGRTIDGDTASKMLTMFSNSEIIPRGQMTASQFLEINTEGTYSPIPYSRLRGEAPGLTKPADHGLLLKMLESGVFTATTAHGRIITPDPFERIYCVQYDPQRLNFASITDNRAIPLASLFSISIKAE